MAASSSQLDCTGATLNSLWKTLIKVLIAPGAAAGGLFAGGFVGKLIGLHLTGGEVGIHGGGPLVGFLMMAGAFAGLTGGLRCGLFVVRRMGLTSRNKTEES